MRAPGSPRAAATRLGGGTGAGLAMNAARNGTGPLDMTMVEPAAEPGRGIAYGTEDASSRIDVPSDRMNLFKAEPGQATRWLHQEGFLPDSGSDAGEGHFYVPREAYGSFIADTLRRTIAKAGARVTFRRRRAMARPLVRRDDGWTTGLSDGSEAAGDLVALCFGHAVPHRPCRIDDAVDANPKVGGWHPLVDALRFELPRVWGGFTSREKKRVLRRLPPLWEVHRFRIAPQVAAALDVSMRTSALRIGKAGLTGLARRDGLDLERFRLWRIRSRLKRRAAASAYGSQGEPDGAETALGLAVDRHSHVLDREGSAWPDLLAFGPMTRGCFGEMTGAPDIAAHFEAQAERLFGFHHEGADRP